jgi:hypothetical protein
LTPEEVDRAVAEITARKAAQVAAARKLFCPRCRSATAEVRWQGCMEPVVGLTERLMAKCAKGHEWLVPREGER